MSKLDNWNLGPIVNISAFLHVLIRKSWNLCGYFFALEPWIGFCILLISTAKTFLCYVFHAAFHNKKEKKRKEKHSQCCHHFLPYSHLPYTRIAAAFLGRGPGVWLYQQPPTQWSPPQSHQACLATTLRLYEPTVPKQWTLPQKINVHLFITADGRESGL